jgi:hypothetical protein
MVPKINDCAGEDQQKFNDPRMDLYSCSFIRLQWMRWVTEKTPPPHNPNCAGWMICSHGDDYEEFYVQGHNTMYTAVSQPTFRRNVPSPSSRVEEYTSTKRARIISACYLLQVTLLVCLFCGPEQEDATPKRLLTSNRLHGVSFHKRQHTNIYHGVNL